MPMTRLKNWSFTCGGKDDGYMPPEMRAIHLHGAVYGHPTKKFEDGDRVRTSQVLRIHHELGVVDCTSRSYMLEGPPNPEWVEWLETEGTKEEWSMLIQCAGGIL